jgi:hypothetical protein
MAACKRMRIVWLDSQDGTNTPQHAKMAKNIYNKAAS